MIWTLIGGAVSKAHKPAGSIGTANRFRWVRSLRKPALCGFTKFKKLR